MTRAMLGLAAWAIACHAARGPTAASLLDRPPTTDGDVTEAWLHGMEILVKRTPGAEGTATQLYIRGGARNWRAVDAGIEQLAVEAAVTGGTEDLSLRDFTQQLFELGSTLSAYATEDFSVLHAWSFPSTWDRTFALLVDAFRRPALPAKWVELVRARRLAALRRELADPDGQLTMVTQHGVFQGHPYENRAIGTLDSVAGLTAAQLAAHLARLRETSRLLLVVVGDIDPAHVIAAAGEALGDLPRGSYQAELPPALPVHSTSSVAIMEQHLPTNYILAMFPGPSWRDPDFVAAQVAMSVLDDREFTAVRTRRSLSYAPRAWLESSRALSLGALYVSAVDPVATMKVMLEEAGRLRSEPVPPRELAATKATLLTAFFVDGESAVQQAWQLGRAQLHAGDWRYVRGFPALLRAVTAEQIQAWAGEHMAHLQTVVLGDPSKIDRDSLEAF